MHINVFQIVFLQFNVFNRKKSHLMNRYGFKVPATSLIPKSNSSAFAIFLPPPPFFFFLFA